MMEPFISKASQSCFKAFTYGLQHFFLLHTCLTGLLAMPAH